jgi:hypothetical protein
MSSATVCEACCARVVVETLWTKRRMRGAEAASRHAGWDLLRAQTKTDGTAVRRRAELSATAVALRVERTAAAPRTKSWPGLAPLCLPWVEWRDSTTHNTAKVQANDAHSILRMAADCCIVFSASGNVRTRARSK